MRKTNISCPPGTHTYVCVSGGKKCSFFGKFGVLRFLDTPVLRFALLPYYRRVIHSIHHMIYDAHGLKRNRLVLCDFSRFAKSQTTTFFNMSSSCLSRVSKAFGYFSSRQFVTRHFQLIIGIIFSPNKSVLNSEDRFQETCFFALFKYFIEIQGEKRVSSWPTCNISHRSVHILVALRRNSNMSCSIQLVACKVHNLTHFSPFLYLLTTSVHQRFSGVFRGYWKWTFAWKWIKWYATQQIFTCSKSTIETEKGVKYVKS